MSKLDPSTLDGLRHLGLPTGSLSHAAGSVGLGCAVQFAMRQTDRDLHVGFHAFAAAEVVSVCELLCRCWVAEKAITAPSLSALLELGGLERSWAGDLLVVVEAATGVAAEWTAARSTG